MRVEGSVPVSGASTRHLEAAAGLVDLDSSLDATGRLVARAEEREHQPRAPRAARPGTQDDAVVRPGRIRGGTEPGRPGVFCVAVLELLRGPRTGSRRGPTGGAPGRSGRSRCGTRRRPSPSQRAASAGAGVPSRGGCMLLGSKSPYSVTLASNTGPRAECHSIESAPPLAWPGRQGLAHRRPSRRR